MPFFYKNKKMNSIRFISTKRFQIRPVDKSKTTLATIFSEMTKIKDMEIFTNKFSMYNIRNYMRNSDMEKEKCEIELRRLIIHMRCELKIKKYTGNDKYLLELYKTFPNMKELDEINNPPNHYLYNADFLYYHRQIGLWKMQMDFLFTFLEKK